MSHSPRGTYLLVADAIRKNILEGPRMEWLPPVSELRETHGVSRGLVNRALNTLKEERLITPVHGVGWQVNRPGVDQRPLPERMRELLLDGRFEVGSSFLGENALCQELGRGRTAVRAALGALEAEGLLSRSAGAARVVRSLPGLAGGGT